ncbi:MAG: hypothetical protein M3Y25_01620 [Thermoproteota archaeon]|nr:hypothetical protein [Thermoproteota archaeon]
MVYNNSIDWNNVIKREARGFNDANLGEVHKIHRDNAITKSGMVNKKHMTYQEVLSKSLIVTDCC